jgi:hypothetical protein
MAGRGPLEATYTYGGEEQQRERDLMGAHQLMSTYKDAHREMDAEDARFWHDVDMQLRASKMLSDHRIAQAKAQHLMRYEAMMSHAIPRLYDIDPNDPDFEKKISGVVHDFPQLMHAVPGYPGMTEDVMKLRQLATTSQQRRDTLQEQKDKAAQQEREFGQTQEGLRLQRDWQHQEKEKSDKAEALTRQEKIDAKTKEDTAKTEAAKQKKIDAVQTEYDKNRDIYQGAMDTSGEEMTAQQKITMNRARQGMIDAATRMHSLDPEQFDVMRKQVEGAVKAQHDVMEQQMKGLPLDKQAPLIPAFNTLKRQLGYNQISDNLDSTGKRYPVLPNSDNTPDRLFVGLPAPAPKTDSTTQKMDLPAGAVTEAGTPMAQAAPQAIIPPLIQKFTDGTTNVVPIQQPSPNQDALIEQYRKGEGANDPEGKGFDAWATQRQSALDWSKANPKDPRSTGILKYYGM